MKLNDFLSNVDLDHPKVIKEESKNLSKEDALEILRSAEKTLTFYINELAPKEEEEEDDNDSALTFIRHSFGDGMAKGELEL